MAVRRVVRGGPVITGTTVDAAPDVVATPHVVAAEQVVEPVARVVTPAASVVESHRVVRRSWSRFAVSQLVHGACGLVMVILGGVTLGRTGFSDLGEHTAEAFGITTTALLGLIELFAGLLLLCAALAPEGRAFGGGVGVVLFVGGLIVAAGSDELLNDLHTESSLGWVAIIVGVVAILGAVLPSLMIDRRTTAVDVW